MQNAIIKFDNAQLKTQGGLEFQRTFNLSQQTSKIDFWFWTKCSTANKTRLLTLKI